MSGAGDRSNKRMRSDDNPRGECPAKIEESPSKEELMAQLAAKDKELEKKDKELEKKDKEIKERDRSAKRRSLKTLLSLDGSAFKFVRTGSDYSHVNGKHTEASARDQRFEMTNFSEYGDRIKLDSVSLTMLTLVAQHDSSPRGDDDGDDDDDASPPGELKFKLIPFCTEADIVIFLTHILRDAMSILGYLGVSKEETILNHERSLFSGQPDILVVRMSQYSLPLLVVEVKKPLKSGSLREKEKALGQAYDYIQSLRAYGHPEPVVVLTTVTETFVCWNSEDDEAANRYEKAVDLAAMDPSTPQKRHACQVSHSLSPPKLETPHSPLSNCISFDEDQASCFVPNPSRELCTSSRAFEAHDLVHVFCTLLCRALCPKSMPSVKKVYKLKPKSVYHFPNVLRLTANGCHYTWGTLDVQIGTRITGGSCVSTEKKPDAKNMSQDDCDDTSAYYVIGKLGYGVTSNVWHALDSNGNEVAIKMYVKTTDAEGKIMERSDFIHEATVATENEVLNLLEIYDFLKEDQVYLVELAGFPCVVMPFFCPLPQGERTQALPEVKTVLERIYSEHNLQYRDGDVRWRHIGTYKEVCDTGPETTRYILYDLADLEHVSTQNTGWVDAQIDELKERIGSEPELEGVEQFQAAEILNAGEEENGRNYICSQRSIKNASSES